MTRDSAKRKSKSNLQKELMKRIQIIGGINNEELGFAVKTNLIKWWELKAWQELKETGK